MVDVSTKMTFCKLDGLCRSVVIVSSTAASLDSERKIKWHCGSRADTASQGMPPIS